MTDETNELNPDDLPHGEGCDCEPSDEDMQNEAFNVLRNAIDSLLSDALGLPIVTGAWVVVAVPQVVHEEGHLIPLEPRVVTERFLPTWQAKGLLKEALDGLSRDDIADMLVDVIDGADDDEG